MSEVLALKYRPKNFNSLIGQDAISTTLSLALSNKRLSHAYLFSGLRGSGKTSTARIFSKSLVCENGPTPKACEKCEHCQMANENRHIDIIEMDAASSRKIDDIRDLIEQTKYKPNTAKFKIFIIDEVHMLTKEAFNALLKTLEEPPSYVKFILATTDPLKLPATILSRTQHFRFKQIAQTDIVHHLSHILNLENVNYETEALEMISRAGRGSLRDSLTLLDQAIIFSKSNITPSEVASMLGLLDSKKLEEIFDAIFCEDRAKLLNIIKELENYECEVVLDELIAFVKTKFYANDTSFSLLLCERFFRILSEAKQLLFLNADSGFVLSLVLFKMVEATNIKKIDSLIASLEQEKFREPIQNPPSTSPQKQAKKPAVKEEIKEEAEEKQAPLVEPKAELDLNTQKFQKLIDELYDRNYDLGELFKQSVSLVGFENGVLTMLMCADEEEKKTLRHGWGVIKQFVQEIYGEQTKIKMDQSVKKNSTKSIGGINSVQKAQKELKQEEQEELPDLTPTLTPEQQAVQNLMKNPIFNEAKRLFEPKSIKINPKTD